MRKIGGRKPLLTLEVQETIVRLLRLGAYRKHAAEAAGVSDNTVTNWLHRGDAGEPRFVEFAVAVRKAQPEDALRCWSIITRAQFGAVDGDWRAAAYTLERKCLATYGRLGLAARATQPGPAVLRGGAATVNFYPPGSDWRREADKSLAA